MARKADDILIGIDIGTTNSKGVACRLSGEVLAEAHHQHPVSIPQPGWMEHDADEVWWGDFVRISRELMELLPAKARVAAVSASACGPCLLPVDAQGQPLRPGILYYVDGRASAQIAALERRHGAGPILRLCGARLSSQSIGPKMLWIADNEPEVFARTRCFLTAPGYVVFRLTGQLVVDHHHASYFTPFIDLRRGRWDLRFAPDVLKENHFPTIRWSHELAGRVTPQAAEATGIPAGTPVAVGSTDGLMEAVAAGVLEPGTLMVNFASSLNLVALIGGRRSSKTLWLSEGLQPGAYVLAGGVATGGSIASWFVRQLAQEFPAEAGAGTTRGLQQLEEDAALSPVGSNGLLMLPYFSGQDTPFYDPDIRGVVLGLNLSTTRNDLYRAVLEGTALGIRHNLLEFERHGVRPQRVRVLGGGTSSRLWLQIVADATQRTLDVPARTTGAAYGSAFLAGLAEGLVDAGRFEREWIRIADHVEPHRSVAQEYDELYGLFTHALEDVRDVVHRLADRSRPARTTAAGRRTTGAMDARGNHQGAQSNSHPRKSRRTETC